MVAKKTQGMVSTRMGAHFTSVTIRAEKTQEFVSLSLGDDSREILIQVPYSDVKAVIREVYKRG